MRARTRWILIAFAAAATGVASFMAPGKNKEAIVVAPAPLATSSAPTAARTSVNVRALPERHGIGKPPAELFASYSWTPPPPPAPPAERTTGESVRSRVPYRFAGTSEQGGTTRYFLSKQGQVVEARPGEALEDGYRVEAVDADGITLLYLPLGIRERVLLDED